jgi:hypothetical protein
MPNRCLTSTSFLQKLCPEAEIQEDVIINVKNDFSVQPFLGGPHRSKLPRDVRHVDAAGEPQFTVTENRVIEINESRRVYRDFLTEKMDDVPIAFYQHAKKLLDCYQREIARKSMPRAILSDRGYFAGELPSKLRPDVIRQEKGQYTYNWFLGILAEYRTAPLSRKGRRVKDRRPYYGAKKAEKIQAYWRAIRSDSDETDSGNISSHSVEY